MAFDFRFQIAPLQRRLAGMISRAFVKRVDDAKKQQLVQVQLIAAEDGETRDLERPQNYGFTSAPVEGAEAVVVFVGGKRDHGLAIVVEDRRYRVGNLESGEVAVYDKTGSTIVFRKNGDIEITPSSGVAKLTGDLHASGDIVAHSTGSSISLASHVHTVATANVVSGSPAVFIPVAGKTGGPV